MKLWYRNRYGGVAADYRCQLHSTKRRCRAAASTMHCPIVGIETIVVNHDRDIIVFFEART